jgi:hypothetical protein
VRQVHDEEVRLLLDTADDDNRFAKIGLSMARRMTDGNGRRYDAEFDLAGIQDAIEAVAGACGWSTLDLSRDDYRAIQTMLNAGGFDAGTPDGVWGNGSRNAMRAFQERNGLAPTGAPDRATLEALGIQASD